MRRDDIERLLASETMIEPSPGFAASVMEAVRSEAAVPAPLAFPWRRVLPGLVLVGLALLAGLGILVSALVTAPASGPAPDWAAPRWLSARLLWLAAGLLGSLLIPWLVGRLSQSSTDTAL